MPRPLAGPLCPARKPSSGAGLIRTCLPPIVPKTVRSTSRICWMHRCGDFNPRYTEAAGALPGKLHFLHTDIYGNRDFLQYLRNQGKFFDHEEDRERDLVLIDYDDPANNSLRGHRGVDHAQRPPRHAAGCGVPDQRHPRAGDRVQERHQGRGHRPGHRPAAPLPPRNARGDGAPAALHRHRRHRLQVRRHLEHGTPQHLQRGRTGRSASWRPR
jgi:hypothetical protein